MLDKEDKIILDHLFAYSRFTTKQLSKAVGMTQQGVSYRIRRLEEKGHIAKYDSILNWNVLPFIKKIYYIRARDSKSLISKIKNFKALFGLNRVIGPYNLLAWCFFKTKDEQRDFERILGRNYWESIEGDNVIFPEISIFDTPLKLNLPERENNLPKLDEIDIKIMKYLSEGHSRDSIAEIGNAVHEDYDLVHYRIRRLVKSNYFFRFAAQVGWNSLDLRLSVIKISLGESNDLEEIIEKLSNAGFFAAIVTDNEKRIHLHLFSEGVDQYWLRVKRLSEIMGSDLESLENIHFDEVVILNRYPFEYLLDKRVRSKMRN